MTICFYDCNGKIISVSDEIPFTVMKYHLPNTLYLRANSKSKPPGAYIWRGDLMERFFHFKVGGWGMHKIWRGLFSEFCSMCKNAPETQLWIKENSNFGENGISSKLRHRKAHFKTRFYLGDLVTCAGFLTEWQKNSCWAGPPVLVLFLAHSKNPWMQWSTQSKL